MSNPDSNSTIPPISAKQTKGLIALLAGGTVEEAAKAAGVSKRAIYAWQIDLRFKAALQAAQAELVQAAQSRLLSGQNDALETLRGVMADTANPSGVRRQAAVDWLSLLFKYREAGEFEERLKALEAAVTP